jgi:transposase
MSYDLIVALDRADREIDVCLLEAGMIRTETVASAPEALGSWWGKLRAERPQSRIAVVFEQPAENLLAFFAEEAVSIYALNPAMVAKFREALFPSGAKDDLRDSRIMADLVAHHHGRLRPWSRQSAPMRRLSGLVEGRRGLVEQRVNLGNQLKATLKKIYPQALLLAGDDLWRPLATAFLRRWPTLELLKKAKPETLRRFYYLQAVRSESVVDERLELIAKAVPLTTDTALTEPAALLITSLVAMIDQVRAAIDRFDKQIESAFPACQDAHLFAGLPGAGLVLAPRLACAFGEDRSVFQSVTQLQSYSGIAPVTKQSGNTKNVLRRWRCPIFLKQTFHEYAACSVRSSLWAKAYYQSQRSRGKRHHASVRALAFKWQRVLFACWQKRIDYDEARYLESLRRTGSPLIAAIEKLSLERPSANNA